MTDSNSESFAALFAEEADKKLKKLTRGEKVKATIVGINGDSVFLDVGGKSEGVMSSAELVDSEGNITVETGDSVEVYYLQNRGGEQLFTKSIGAGSSAAHLQEAFNASIPVEGFVKAEIKGGFEITLGGNVRAFCPYSQMGLRRVEDAAGEYLETHRKFLITRFEENGRNLVVSARAILEREKEELLEKLKETLSEGQTVTGEISSIRDFGAFVDLGGADGLIPVSEIAWSRVDKVEDCFTVGQKVEVLVKSIDWKKERISLSYKATQADPWDEVATTFPIASSHTGRVVRLAQFGAFINLAPSIDGLLHISKLGNGRRINHPREVLEEGQEIDVKIDAIDLEERRISLVPADYVSEESEVEKERKEYRNFINTQKRESGSKTGSFGALLQAKIKEKNG